ncbi:hypothetical protein [Novipirellula rosea]|uniref:Uncharacterized protein n=1 Tax=Novipirellula rosea TaxID=1031540 RepID=A0ABP8N965_9BACT
MENPQPDLRESAIYRRFGITGLRWFSRIYFPTLMILLLAVFIATIYASQFLVEPQRAFTYSGGIVLSVVGIAVLARVWRGYNVAVDRIDKEDPNERNATPQAPLD